MPIKFERVKVGMTLWKTERRKMGHTTMSETVARSVVVKSIDVERAWVTGQGGSGMVSIPASRLKSWSAVDPRRKCCGGVGKHRFGCVQGDSR